MKLLKKLPKLSAIARYTLSFLLISLFYVLSFNAAADTEVIYYHNDALGSPVAATDQNGDVIWTEDYAPYGAKLSDDMEAIIEKVGYTGHRYDNDTGLVYAGARMYDPSLGRFMGIDPVGAMAAVNNPVMFNRYAYGNNNPYKYVDPDGEYAELAIEAISLGLGIASFSSNVSDGNYGSAAIDGVGIVVDVVGAIFPIVPGVAGLGIKSLREGGEAVTKGGTETVQRWMSKAELKATQETGLLRGGREGTHYHCCPV